MNDHLPSSDSSENSPAENPSAENPPTENPAPGPPPGEHPAPAGNPPPAGMSANSWASLLHFSQLGGYLLPGLGFAAPIVIWLIQKDRFPALDAHGKMVTNWLISALIYSVAIGIVGTATCGLGYGLYVPLGLLTLIFPVVGGIKAGDGEVWKYPLTFDFVK